MKAYKVFNKDWKCLNYSFKKGNKAVSTVHELKGELILCENGFHFCRNLTNCFNYYNFHPENKVAQIEILGDYIGSKEDKECTNKFKIIKELTWNEVLNKVNSGVGNSGHRNSGDYNSGYYNSGHRNSGYRNSGYYNSGHRNSGHYNSGDYNSGDYNSGDYNSGDYNSGFFNSKTPNKILIFNKELDRDKWNEAIIPSFIYNVSMTKWIYEEYMTEEEKKSNKHFYTTKGYLKNISYKDSWKEAFDNASKEDVTLLKNLPNFDKKVFEEITGIKVK